MSEFMAWLKREADAMNPFVIGPTIIIAVVITVTWVIGAMVALIEGGPVIALAIAIGPPAAVLYAAWRSRK